MSNKSNIPLDAWARQTNKSIEDLYKVVNELAKKVHDIHNDLNEICNDLYKTNEKETKDENKSK